MHQLLILQGYLTVLGLGGWMLYRYLRRQEDLLTPWFFYLGGCICFLGFPSIYTGFGGQFGHREDFPEWVFVQFLLGVIVFFLFLVATYYGFRRPDRWAARCHIRWPAPSVGTLLVALVLCFGMYFFLLRPPPIPVVSHILGMAGVYGPTIALSLAIVAWNRDKTNPFLIAIAVFTLLAALVVSVGAGSGRRNLMAVLLTLPIVLYWLRWRYQNPVWTAGRFAALGLGAMILLTAYSQFRHGTRGETGFGTGLRRMTMVVDRVASGDFGDVGESLFATDTTETALLSIYTYGPGRPFPRQPFHTLYFIVANPVPRIFWADKPKGLGYLLPQVHYRLQGSNATLGPGVIGHAFHEGGLWMCAFYGVLFAVVLRFATELVRLEPGNPYLLGMFAAASSNILTIPRGDMGTMTMQVVGSFLCGAIVFWVLRLLTPTSRVSYRAA